MNNEETNQNHKQLFRTAILLALHYFAMDDYKNSSGVKMSQNNNKSYNNKTKNTYLPLHYNFVVALLNDMQPKVGIHTLKVTMTMITLDYLH